MQYLAHMCMLLTISLTPLDGIIPSCGYLIYDIEDMCLKTEIAARIMEYVFAAARFLVGYFLVKSGSES